TTGSLFLDIPILNSSSSPKSSTLCLGTKSCRMEYRFGITGCFSLRCQPSPPTTPSPRGTSLSTSSNPPPRRCFPTESKSSSNLDDHLSGILSAEHTEERVYAVLDAVDDALVVFEFVIGK